MLIHLIYFYNLFVLTKNCLTALKNYKIEISRISNIGLRYNVLGADVCQPIKCLALALLLSCETSLITLIITLCQFFDVKIKRF